MFGGLGVRDLVCFNKALLGKWAWRALEGGDWLWLDLVREYGGGVRGRLDGLEMINEGSRVKGWWRNVTQCLSDRVGGWFRECVARKVGDGTSTRFWEDVWVGESSLKTLFPRLFEVSLAKGCSVAEVGEWVEDRWVWRVGWRRDLRSWENEALSSLMLLLVCRKQVQNVPDVWVWKLESSNEFTVRSAYKCLLERKLDFNTDLKIFCRLVWDNLAPLKAQATAWRILFRKIATRVELQRRGVIQDQVDVNCPLCNSAAETVEHLFVECNRTASVWSGCIEWLGVEAPMSNNIPENLLQFCSLGSGKFGRVLLASMWVCTTWLIWNSRNAVIFNNEEWKHDKIMGDIKSFLWNWGLGKGRLVRANLNFHEWCNNPVMH